MPGKFTAKNVTGDQVYYFDPDFPDRGGWIPRDFLLGLSDEFISSLPVQLSVEYKETLYLIGSLRNEAIPSIGNELRSRTRYDIFDDWFAAGPIADDSWQAYEKAKGIPYGSALRSYAARHVFDFDILHLNRSSGGILCLPAGKSGHLELGYLCGQGKPCYVLFDKEPERWDVMYQFATGGVYFNLEDLIKALNDNGNNSARS